MAGLDLNSILQAAAQFTQQNNAGTAAIQQNAAQQQELAGQSANLLVDIGNADQIIALAKDTAALKTQQASQKAANTFGTNMLAQGEQISRLAQIANQEFEAKDQLSQKIIQKQSVGIMDNPMEWLLNQFTIDNDIAEHNAHNQRGQAATQRIQELNQNTQATVQTQKMLDESVTQAAIEANQRKIADAAAVNANQAKLEGLKYNTEGIKAALAGAQANLQTTMTVFGAKKQEEQIGIALQHLSLSQQQFDLQKQKFEWEKEEKAKQGQGDYWMIQNVNQGLMNLYGENAQLLEPGTTKATQILALMKNNLPGSEGFRAAFYSGLNTNNTGVKMIAATPGEAIELMHTLPGKMAFSPAQQPVKELFGQVVAATQQAGAANPDMLKKPELRKQFMSQFAQQLADEQAKQVKIGDRDNIYQIPSLSTLIQTSPVIAKLPLTQKVIAPAIKAGVDLSDPDKVFAVTATALRKGEISYREAVDLAAIYNVAQHTNIEARQLTSVGIVPRFSYNVRITTNPVATFGDTEIVDMTKFDAVGRSLNRYLSAMSNPFAQRTPGIN
jgi:hypothetical protein